MLTNNVDILGTKYTIETRNINDDSKLETLDGYCDTSIKLIVVNDMKDAEIADDLSLEDMSYYKKKVLRHEIIHAFLYESGLHTNCEWVCEEMIDWLAIQFPKLNSIINM